MATTVAIKFSPTLKDPKWPKLTAKSGEELELAATPVNVTTQTACFEIRNKAGNIVALLDVDSSCKKKWIPLATPKDEEYVFHALLRDKPSAANGYLAVVSRTESINKLTVKATTITDLALDKCFVPKLEKLVAKFKIGGELPAKGRIEIWGERYPTGKPLYAADFVPAAENTWKWDGKKNDAAVIAKVGEYISPQFSPYRLRIIVGQDDDAVKEPYLKGLGKATVADQQFEIIVQKVQIRVQAGYADAGDAKYHLRKALAIEKTPGTPQANGSFAAMGRLPKENESGRIRIPLVSHWGTNQLFDQAGNQATGDNLRVGMGYVVTRTKYAIDSALHTRPEIPVEFEARLRSRKHAAAPTSPSSLLGRFEPEALGPLRLEPFAEDYPSPVERAHGNELDDIYAAASVNNTYFKHAVLKIKQANHSAPNPTGNPVNDGARPVFSFWNARFVVAADDDVTFDFVTRDPGFSYATGSNELTVYLNRTKLTLGTDDQMTKKYKDYKEESATAIKLRTGLTKRGDILWVARNVAAPVVGGVVLRWNNYPLGTNSHEFYGGIRAAKPNNLFLADYSPVPGGSREPIPTLAVTGATNAAPIKVTTGAVHGLATGQEVVIKDVTGNLDANGTFKVTKVSDTEVTLDESDGIDADAFSAGGTLRRTNVTNATPIVITCAADHNLANDDSVYVAAVGGNTAANGVFRVTVVDARNFRLNDSDGSYSDPYTTGGTVQHGGIIDVHRGANLKRYKTIYDGVPGLAAGQITLTGPAEIQKQFAPFDTYRVFLPPGLPAGYKKVASNAIHLLPKGRTSGEAMAAVAAAIKAHVTTLENNSASPAYVGPPAIPPGLAAFPKLIADARATGAVDWQAVVNWIKAYVEAPAQDVALDVGAAAVPIYTAGDASAYYHWANGKGTAISNALLAALSPPVPSSAQPKSMPVMRWPEFFQHGVWIDGKTKEWGDPDFQENSDVKVGFCSPSGWSMFEAQTDDPTASTFTHEMGHGCHLSHFVVDGNDFNWKQHHLLSGDCLMSYEHTSGYLTQPAGAVGPTAGAANDTGWPNTVLPPEPALPPPDPPYRPENYLSIDAAVAVGDPTIAYVAPTVVGAPCAKCILKLRGWNEEKLPCAWNHPDLY